MIKLVKTNSRGNGPDRSCARCGLNHFIASGKAWSCSDCGLYIPTLLSMTKDVKNVIRALDGIVKGNGKTN